MLDQYLAHQAYFGGERKKKSKQIHPSLFPLTSG